MAKQDEQRLLVKIATLYYLEGRKQSDIAQLLSLSQSFVSRAITRCQKEGVVKISVVQPSNIFLKLEKGLRIATALSRRWWWIPRKRPAIIPSSGRLAPLPPTIWKPGCGQKI